MFPVEYLSDVLRRLISDPNFTSRSWDPESVRWCRKKVQLLANALRFEDLLSMRSLGVETGFDEHEPATIPINDQYALALTLKTEGGRTALLLDLVELP